MPRASVARPAPIPMFGEAEVERPEPAGVAVAGAVAAALLLGRTELGAEVAEAEAQEVRVASATSLAL